MQSILLHSHSCNCKSRWMTDILFCTQKPTTTPVVNQLNPANTITPCFSKIHFCIVLLWAICFCMIYSIEILHSKGSNHRCHFSNLHWFGVVASHYVNYWCKWKCIVTSLSSSSSPSSTATQHGFWSSTADHSRLLSLRSWL